MKLGSFALQFNAEAISCLTSIKPIQVIGKRR